ncbi:MAG: hypothetical protein V4525_11565 [Pseudomonadota bacterium]
MGISDQELKRKNVRLGLYLLAVVLCLFGLAFYKMMHVAQVH